MFNTQLCVSFLSLIKTTEEKKTHLGSCCRGFSHSWWEGRVRQGKVRPSSLDGQKGETMPMLTGFFLFACYSVKVLNRLGGPAHISGADIPSQQIILLKTPHILTTSVLYKSKFLSHQLSCQSRLAIKISLHKIN